MTYTRFSLSLLALVLTTSPALAHLPAGEHGSFLAGASHPLFGLDHVIAMLAVGVWALQIGGRGIWAVPAGFVGAMALGYIAAGFGAPLPLVEPMILASSIVFGIVVLLALRPTAWIGIAVAAFFGLFHGHAHGAELGDAQALTFGIGFIVVTAALHALGIVMAQFMARAHPLAPRFLGAASAALGLSLVLS
ncbi:HupE/UreJ family protein [Celeribacter marinus]|uniref:HupE-UreJ family metal transporter n=1 Tax=Celeribacter marinus TaxID=1397108 RepID=A0A0N9ZMN2_9RHOB|nr:HupE/UreJ family protein [Celeribacter marinus]ALI54582.1 hupE-UreJ family metal transporter [Celeribacter marinus]SFK50101.1 urease accessory protein [Celeribacter marinus]